MKTLSPAEPEPGPAQQMIALLFLLGLLVFLKCDGVYSGMGLLFVGVTLWIGKQYTRSQVILYRMTERPATSVPQP